MLRTAIVTFIALILSLLLLFLALNTPPKVSPQGCRMSYMYPSYIIQTGLNASWTSASLANRYKLELYREVGWDPNDELRGVPVLFIPGNAGSAHQVRSIASSAARQYYSSPSYMNPYLTSRGLRPLDVYAVDFNEDLSAFHGPTLESERQYTAAAIDYIVSLYRPGTKIIIIGHSMGGIVGVSLLPSDKISAIITMSTPHSVPPARFDARMDHIFAKVQETVAHDLTPILSICGGITDTMIPSEFCSLPQTLNGDVFRKTVFSSALEGCWTGVGHREMVWCHQVRWRVARAALEFAGAATNAELAGVMNEWFRDGIELSNVPVNDDTDHYEYSEGTNVDQLAEDRPLVIKPSGVESYDFPIPYDQSGRRTANFVLYLSQGVIASISPYEPLPLKASAHICRQNAASDSSSSSIPTCVPLLSSSLMLLPNPVADKPFPVPSEGVDEADGVVAFSAPVPYNQDESLKQWVNLRVENKGDKGWAVASLSKQSSSVVVGVSAIAPLYSSVLITLDRLTLQSIVKLPNVLSNVLLVYRAVPKLYGSCEGVHLPPILFHTSGLSEGHYHRLQDGQPTLLHGHSSAPFLPMPSHLLPSHSRGLNFTIYSSGECGVGGLVITLDLWNSFGRWGARYWNAILAWCAGTVAFVFYSSWEIWDSGEPMPSPCRSLGNLTRILPKAMAIFFLFSFLPLSSSLWLGNVGDPIFAPIAPVILLISCGLVCFSWFSLVILLTLYSKLTSVFQKWVSYIFEPLGDVTVFHRGGIATILLMSALVFLFVPWQVAFLAFYLMHFHHCATLMYAKTISVEQQDAHNQKLLILLLMTWCLPVVAPVLAVWVRTLLTAGFTTPFDGDHFVLNVIAFMVLTYIMSISNGSVFLRRHRLEFISVPHVFALSTFLIFLVGPRSTYRTYEGLNWPTLVLLCFRAAPKFWSGPSIHQPTVAISPIGSR